MTRHELGASISFFTVFSLAPMLLAAISVAGIVFGHDAGTRRVVGELGGLLGEEAAEALEAMIISARDVRLGHHRHNVGVVCSWSWQLAPL
jgi:membrane protein